MGKRIARGNRDDSSEGDSRGTESMHSTKYYLVHYIIPLRLLTVPTLSTSC